MAITSKTFATLVSDFAAAVQGSARGLVDFTIGSILRTIGEASSATALWLQAVAYQVLKVTRLATSTGLDADSYVNDFGMFRLASSVSTGVLTFSRFTSTLQAVVPVGALVSSSDGTLQFIVTTDAGNSGYSATAAPGGLPGYVIAANVSSGNVPAQAVNGGAVGNVLPGAITLINTGIAGVDTVTNQAAFAGGADTETDAALRVRFVNFIAALARATNGAIGYALQSIQVGLQYTITENADYSTALDYGFLTIVVDDGTGTPPAGLITTATLAVDAYRAAGVRFGVFPPVVVTATISFTIVTVAPYNHSTLVAGAAAAVQSYVQAIGLGNPLYYARLEQVIFDSSPGIVNVTSLLVNGGTADIIATKLQVVKPGTITVS